MTTEQRQQLETAIGGYLSSARNPCGVEFYHEPESDTPWRIADDHAEESYATFEDLLAATADWKRAFDADEAFEATQEQLGLSD
jgi:hypothetical protein